MFPRIESDHLLLDLRSVLSDEDSQLVVALRQMALLVSHQTNGLGTGERGGDAN
ncbi:MAG: hypothetical protein NT069_32935 [Planctomycetota bacterium]|nr:hypothetical protein [Planctomycetota bacterium]